MSVNVGVTRELEFRAGQAVRTKNVRGPMKERLKHFKDDFMVDTLNTNAWALSVPGTSDTIAIAEVAGGGEALLTTGTADNDSSMLASPIIYRGTDASQFEVRLTIDDVSGCGVFVGFSDAKSESNNSVAIHYPGDTLTTVASTAVGFVIDADHSSSSIMIESVDGDTDGTSVDVGVDWTDGEERDLRVVLDTDGNASFYIDGDSVGYVASAVTVSTLMCFTVQVITRANDGANTIQLRRVDIWTNEV
jgi:hypothetical protein